MKRAVLIIFSVLGVMFASACSTVNPDTSQVALHYSGGSFSNQSFVSCVGPGQREINSVNENYFYYPHGRRTFSFRTDPSTNGIATGAEDHDLIIGTKGVNPGQPGPQAHVSGTITFQIIEDCAPYTDAQKQFWPGGHLQKFNDTIGRQSSIYVKEPDTEPDAAAWNGFLQTDIGGPAGKAMNAESLNYTINELYSDVTKRDAFVHSVELGPDGTVISSVIQRLVDQQMGDHFVEITNVQIGQPTPPADWLAQLSQAGVLQQQAANAKAAQDQVAGFPGGVNGYLDYQSRKADIDNRNKIADATAHALNDSRVQVIPVPEGSPVIVGGK